MPEFLGLSHCTRYCFSCSFCLICEKLLSVHKVAGELYSLCWAALRRDVSVELHKWETGGALELDLFSVIFNAFAF